MLTVSDCSGVEDVLIESLDEPPAQADTLKVSAVTIRSAKIFLKFFIKNLLYI